MHKGNAGRRWIRTWPATCSRLLLALVLACGVAWPAVAATDPRCLAELQDDENLLQGLVPQVRVLDNRGAEAAWARLNNEVLRLRGEAARGRPDVCAQLPGLRGELQGFQGNLDAERRRVAAQVQAPLPTGPAGWEQAYGWRAHYQADPAAPAVLLIHGVAATEQTWTEPLAMWSLRNMAFDPKAEPAFAEASIRHPFAFAWSPRAPGHNFWNELAQHLHVATWNQAPCVAAAAEAPSPACLDSDVFDAAYQSAQWALQKLLAETRGPVTLIGHSRGGLIVRRLLKEHGDAGGRIRQAIMLHSPHGGSQVGGRQDAAYGHLLSGLETLIPERHWREEVSSEGARVQETLVHLSGFAGTRELDPALVPRALAQGEKPLPGVRYITFGGTSPVVLRLHIRTYPEKHREHTLSFPDSTALPELTLGRGDALVTDQSAQAPWLGARHYSNPLHHGEVLWTEAVIRQVTALASEPTGQ